MFCMFRNGNIAIRFVVWNFSLELYFIKMFWIFMDYALPGDKNKYSEAFTLKLLQQNHLNKLSNVVSRCDTVF